MSGCLKIFIVCIGFSLFPGTSMLKAQILKDTATLNLVKKNIDYIYNLQFSNALETYKKIIKAYPEHPIVFLIRGMMTYWENYPLHNKTSAQVSFEEDMRQCIKLSEAHNDPVHEAEYLMSNLCARGFLLLFYSDNDLIMEVIPLATSSYKYLMRSFDFTTSCPDLYYFTGVYNYYREAYPIVYPVYRSLVFPFPKGDMVKGLRELQLSATKSVALRAESYVLLSGIILNFENRYTEAIYYNKTLYEQYPQNPLYQTNYIKNLLLIKQYGEAEKLMSALPEEPENKYLHAQLLIFKGILQEKKYHNNKLAQQYYNTGLGIISFFGHYGDDYASYAYFGLSRISDVNGDKHISKIYRKEALKLSDFTEINFDK
jgi:hypothetical protein